MTRPGNARRRAIASGALLATALLLGVPGTARAQGVQVDTRWQAWLGCWERIGAPRPAWESGRRLVCVIPAAGTSAVEIVMVADTQIIARERIEASGERSTNDREGCTGWERAQWSADGRRVYRTSAYTCPGGVEQLAGELIAMTPTGEWLDIQSVTVAGNTGVRSLRYGEAERDVALPGDIDSALAGQGGLAVRAARTAAGVPLSAADVWDAAQQVDSTLVVAWLAERGQGFRLNARGLAAMADAGMPGGVVDVMVALSYPNVFRVNPVTREPELLPRGKTPPNGYAYSGTRAPTLSAYSPYRDCYSTYAYDRASRLGAAYMDPAYLGTGYIYSNDPSLGYWDYSYPSAGCRGYGSWYWNTSPVVIVQGGGGAGGSGSGAQPHGRVVKGEGYSQGNTDPAPRSSGTGGSGAPAEQTAQPGGSTSSEPSGSSSTTSSGRTAKPRP